MRTPLPQALRVAINDVETAATDARNDFINRNDVDHKKVAELQRACSAFLNNIGLRVVAMRE